MKFFETPRQISKLAIFAEHHYYCWNSIAVPQFSLKFPLSKENVEIMRYSLSSAADAKASQQIR